MRQVSFEGLITKSINRTKLILFQPFSLKKWLCLLLIAYLAGNIGGGSSFSGGGRGKDREAEAAEQDNVLGNYDSQVNPEGYADKDLLDGWTGRPRGEGSINLSFLKSGVGLGIIGIVGFFVFALILLFTWLGARFKFIWFSSVVANDASIREPFQRYKREGDSLFKFYLLLFFMAIIFFGLIALWAYTNGASAGVFKKGADISFIQIFNVFALPVLVLIVGIIILVILNMFLEHFVLTIMAMDRCTFVPAWKKFRDIAGQNKKDMFLFILVMLGLTIVTGILAVLIAFICIMAALLVAGLLIGLPYLLIVGLFKAMPLFVVFAVIVGIPLILAAILLLICANLPFAVFFKSFALYFVSSLDCGYKPLLLEDVG